MSDGYFAKRLSTEGLYGTTPGATVVEKKVVNYSRYRAGANNPKWKVDIANGVNASTPLSGYEQEVTFFPLDATVGYSYRPTPTGAFTDYVTRVKGAIQYQAPWPLDPHSGTGRIDEATAQATKRLYRMLRRVRSQFAGGIVAGEAHKTLDLVVRPARTLAFGLREYHRAARKLRRLVKSPKDLSKALADLYLEATFGWQPLLSDIADGAKALQRLSEKSRKVKFRVYAEMVGNPTLSTLSWNQNNAIIVRNREVVRTDSVIYYGAFKDSVLKTLAEDRLQRVIDLSGFSLRDVLPTLWELLPWSFLVDYFTNIGDLIEAFVTDTSMVGWLNKVVVSKSVQTSQFDLDRAATMAIFALPYSKFNYASSSTGTTICSYRSMSRQKVIDVPTMSFSLESPGLWSRKALNMVALARSVSRRFR